MRTILLMNNWTWKFFSRSSMISKASLMAWGNYYKNKIFVYSIYICVDVKLNATLNVQQSKRIYGWRNSQNVLVNIYLFWVYWGDGIEFVCNWLIKSSRQYQTIEYHKHFSNIVRLNILMSSGDFVYWLIDICQELSGCVIKETKKTLDSCFMVLLIYNDV